MIRANRMGSSLILVNEPNGDFRICIDSTNLNKTFKREYFSVLTYTDVISCLKDAKVFSVLDVHIQTYRFCNIA